MKCNHNCRNLNSVTTHLSIKTTRKFGFLLIQKQSTHLARVKVRPGKHVLEMSVTILVLLLHHDHGIRLAQERPSRPELTQLNELQYDLSQKESQNNKRQK